MRKVGVVIDAIGLLRGIYEGCVVIAVLGLLRGDMMEAWLNMHSDYYGGYTKGSRVCVCVCVACVYVHLINLNS